MSVSHNRLLLISENMDVNAAVDTALGELDGIKLQTEAVSVARLNGAAVNMLSKHDLVVIHTDPDDAADLAAIKSLQKKRGEHSAIIALTNKDIPLSRARELSDAGVDDVLPFPMPAEDLSKQIRSWIDRVARSNKASATNHDGAIIAVAQARGGIGATTVAVNLADQLIGKKSRFSKGAAHEVAILDLDLQFGTVGDFLDVDPSEGLMELALDGITPDQEWLQETLKKTESGLNVLTAPMKFAPLDAISDAQIEALLKEMRTNYDYTVIDLPRPLVSWIEPVLTQADKIIIVADTTVPSVRAAKRLLEFYSDDRPGIEVEIVINREKKPFMQAVHHKEAAKILETKFEHWLPMDANAARSSVDYGKPLSQVAARSDLTKSIGALAQSIMTAMPATQRATSS